MAQLRTRRERIWLVSKHQNRVGSGKRPEERSDKKTYRYQGSSALKSLTPATEGPGLAGDTATFLKRVDFPLLAGTLALLAFGVVMVLSATLQENAADPHFYLKRQLTWGLIGIVAMTVVALVDYHRWRTHIITLYGLIVLALLTVFLFPASALGAQRWILVGPLYIQPSELAKLIIIIALAAFLAERKGELGPRDVAIGFLILAPPLILILRQPDLGTALVLLAILMGMLLMAGIKVQHLAALVMVGVVAGTLAINFHLLHDYQIDRLLVFVNPDIDPQGAGYSLFQSKIAIGSGSLFGKGVFSGTQTNLGFIPTRFTDFIFAVVGERLGFVGAAGLLLLYLLMISRAIAIAALARNLMGTLLAVGIASMWIFQVLVNAGMTIGIMPITGIPLPFLSYGGSSLVANLVAAGLLLNIYAFRFRSPAG